MKGKGPENVAIQWLRKGLLEYMGQIYVEGYSFKKWSYFFLSLKAHYGQVFDPSNKSFEFLSLSWCGHPKNVMYNTHLSYRGSVALEGPRVVS